jgi:CRISPR type IV-associated protein Csf1
MEDQCAICRQEVETGFKKKEIIGSSFLDYEFLSDSQWICKYCAACLGYGQTRQGKIRTTSFIATPSRLIRLKREHLWDMIFKGQEEPFVFCVTYAHKKHLSFKAPVNLPEQGRFIVRTDNSNISIVPGEIQKLCRIIQVWYTVVKETQEAPTCFTKKDVLFGCTNHKRIMEYGIIEYLEEDLAIRPYRNTGLLELLVFALNKQPKREAKVND